jgi:outer membrane protein
MKRWTFATLFSLFLPLCATAADAPGAAKIGTVNFKLCVEESKLGKQEQASFEAMKKQMETVVEEKEKTLNDLANKLNDPDQLDLMSPEAETELKRKFRGLSQEMNQIQQQFYQTLQQANFKIVQTLSEAVNKASEQVAKDQKIDLVLNDETCFFANKALDVSTKVVTEMDKQFDQTSKKGPEAGAAGK